MRVVLLLGRANPRRRRLHRTSRRTSLSQKAVGGESVGRDHDRHLVFCLNHVLKGVCVDVVCSELRLSEFGLLFGGGEEGMHPGVVAARKRVEARKKKPGGLLCGATKVGREYCCVEQPGGEVGREDCCVEQRKKNPAARQGRGLTSSPGWSKRLQFYVVSFSLSGLQLVHVDLFPIFLPLPWSRRYTLPTSFPDRPAETRWSC